MTNGSPSRFTRSLPLLAPSTFRLRPSKRGRWATLHTTGTTQDSRRAIVTAFPSKDGRGSPIVPFVGLAEGMVLAAIRRKGVQLQRIRPALKVLTNNLGLEHALASRALYTDRAEILYDFAETIDDSPEAGDVLEVVSQEFGVPIADLEDALRVASRRAA
jgi:hypothetical protein